MKHIDDEIGLEHAPVVFRMSTSEFQQEVIEKLGRLEAMMDTLVGNGQPGRMKQAEDKIQELIKNDVRRSVYDRIVNAAIAVAVSAAIAMHDRWVK